jgi:hypothetical protein
VGSASLFVLDTYLPFVLGADFNSLLGAEMETMLSEAASVRGIVLDMTHERI